MKRDIIMTMATIALMTCFVQLVVQVFVRDYIEGKVHVNTQKAFVAAEELRLDSIEVPSPKDVVLSECSLSNETAVISQLAFSSELSEEEIIKCGQAVVYVEMRYLGCKDAPELVNDDCEVSYYDAKENKIYFSENEDISGYQEYIFRVVHLAYHAYQYQQIAMYEELHASGNQYDNLLVLTDAKYWTEEKDNYTGCSKENSNLWMEMDSEKYALSSLSEYIDVINDYWEGSEPEDIIGTFTEV